MYFLFFVVVDYVLLFILRYVLFVVSLIWNHIGWESSSPRGDDNSWMTDGIGGRLSPRLEEDFHLVCLLG